MGVLCLLRICSAAWWRLMTASIRRSASSAPSPYWTPPRARRSAPMRVPRKPKRSSTTMAFCIAFRPRRTPRILTGTDGQVRQEADPETHRGHTCSYGKPLWTVEGKDTLGYQSVTLIAQGNRVLFQNTEAILCLDAKTGKELWRREHISVLERTAYTPPTLLIFDNVVLSADRQATTELVGESTRHGRQ